MYRKDGGAFPDPLLNLTWDYTNPVDPDPGRTGQGDERPGAGRSQGRRRRRRRCKAGQQLDGFAQLRDDGTTASGCWIFSGCYTEKGNQMARRDATRPARAGHRAELGVGVAGEPAHPLQPRQRRPRRASRGIRPSRSSSGTAAKWVGIDVPDYAPTTPAVRRGRPVHHERRRRSGACSRSTRWWRDRSPSITSRSKSPSPNVLHPKVRSESGGARVRRRPGGLRDRGRIPLCRHHLSADRAFPLLDQARADQRDPAAGGVRRDRRGSGEGEGHRAGRLGARRVQARRRSSARPM